MYRVLRKSFLVIQVQTQKCSSVQKLRSLKFLCTVSTSSSCNGDISFKPSSTYPKDFSPKDQINFSVFSQVESESRVKLNLLIKFFETSGFSQTQAKFIVSKFPLILRLDPEKVFGPKICFLRSLGLSELDVANIFSKCPHLLGRSLNNHLIPTFDSLRALFGEQHAVTAIKRMPYVLSLKVANNLLPNLSSLRNIGVPDSQISKMMNRVTVVRILGGTKPDRFNNIVSAVLGMGFCARGTSFEHAISAMAIQSESSWGAKLRFYESLGFSKKEILSMFRKQPLSMWMSEKKMRKTLEFYVKKFNLSPSQLSERPNILLYSLEKRIIPRCSVLQVLASRNLIQKSISIVTLLLLTEKKFHQTFVSEYMDEIPEVLDAYKVEKQFSICEDLRRNQSIHSCFQMLHYNILLYMGRRQESNSNRRDEPSLSPVDRYVALEAILILSLYIIFGWIEYMERK
ncbi:hypothetical protein NMG60_11005179 [Bertholletia excelsa]